MNKKNRSNRKSRPSTYSRRNFITTMMGATVSVPFLKSLPGLSLKAPKKESKSRQIEQKIKLGVVGCGGRGRWIAELFHKHGGYNIHAVADYFQSVADTCGDLLGVNKTRRFSGLSGYKKLIESGIEAIALETPPYFFPKHAQVAVESGLHVYMAKPVAVDVPGCVQIEALSRQASKKKRCFLVDYQMPTDPVNIEVAKRIQEGGIGNIAQVASFGISEGFPDPPKTETIEDRLQELIWVNDIALGCDYIGNYDIHAIDSVIWILGQRPAIATGSSQICRLNPHGDSRDVCSVVFKYPDGTVHNHFGQALKNNTDSELTCKIFGQTANALINYWGKSYVRGGPKHYVGDVTNLYQAGAERNINSFYHNVVGGQFKNDTVQRAVDGALATILGREAAARQRRLTMDELLKENKKLVVDLKGLKT